MSNLREQCDFMSAVVQRALRMGMRREQFDNLAETAWLVLTAEPASSQETRSDDGKLWAMHVPGPDDVYACESKAAAEQRAREHNDAIRKVELARQFGMEPATIEARVIEWPHSAESHAVALLDGIAETL